MIGPEVRHPRRLRLLVGIVGLLGCVEGALLRWILS